MWMFLYADNNHENTDVEDIRESSYDKTVSKFRRLGCRGVFNCKRIVKLSLKVHLVSLTCLYDRTSSPNPTALNSALTASEMYRADLCT